MSNSADESIAEDPTTKDLVAEDLVVGIGELFWKQESQAHGSYIEDFKRNVGAV